jgi:plasmid maintenance system antidote protein VapI
LAQSSVLRRHGRGRCTVFGSFDCVALVRTVRTVRTIPPGEILLEEYLKSMGSVRSKWLLKTSPQLWMRLQADWDLHRAMRRERKAPQPLYLFCT